MSMLIFILGAMRALLEVAGLCLLAQGIMHVLAGARRESNPIYQLFRLIAGPAVTLMRRCCGDRLPSRYLPWLTFFALFFLWIGLAYLRQQLLFSSF